MGVLGITQSKASRHLRYLYHLGWVNDRREGVWMNYRLSVAPGSPEDKQLKLLADILSSSPRPRLCGSGWSSGWQPKGRAKKARRVSVLLSLTALSAEQQMSQPGRPET